MTHKISLKDFLKKYTAISNKFIDSYYKFYEMCETQKFGINVTEVINYLGLTHHRKKYEQIMKSIKIILLNELNKNQQKEHGIHFIIYLLIHLKKYA